MNEQLKVIITAEIDKLKSELKKGKEEIQNFAKKSQDAIKEAKDMFGKASEGIKKGLKVATGAVTGTATALLALGASTKEYREAQAKLNSAFEAAGSSADTAKGVYNDLYRVLGDSDVSVEAANHLAKLTTNQEDLSEWTKICEGVFATFGDSLPIEGLTEAANETAKVGQVTGPLADALNWAGISEDEFNEKLAACADEQEREALIRETLNGLYEGAAGQYEENAAGILAQNEAQAKLNEATAKLGKAIAPVQAALAELVANVLTQITPYIQDFADKYGPTLQEVLGKVAKAIGDVISWIVDNWGVISTIATIIGAIAAAILVVNAALTAYSTVMAVVNAVMAASPITWIIVGITALIAAIILCIVYWDEISKAMGKAWDWMKEKTSEAIDAIVGLFNKIIDFVKDNWQGLLLLIVNPFAGAFKLAYDNCEGFRNKVNEIFTKIKDGIKEKLNAAKETVVNIFTGIKTAISEKATAAKETALNIFDVIKSGISNKINAVKNNVTNTFNAVKSAITNPIETAKNVVHNAVEAMKGFFHFSVSLPHIKLPHFKIHPSGWQIGDLLKGKIPKLGIDWYAKGGVFEHPTAFGMNGNNIMVGGEAGAEAMVPLEKNTKWLDIIADKLATRQSNTPIVLNVDGKTFAQTSVRAINDLTAQTGSLGLKLY